MGIRPREGDLVQTSPKWISDVKGLVHPPDKIIAFPRFVPDPRGNRRMGGIAYKKVYSLPERYEILEEQLPHYLVHDPVFGERLCEVPKQDVKHHYNPVDRLRELRSGSQLDELETQALRLAEFLQNHSSIPWNKLGVSGSLLAKLHTPESDIDPIVYGRENCLKTYETLRTAMQDERNTVKAYTAEELKGLYDFRSQDTQMPFDDFAVTERRKVLQGKFLQHDFFVRCIKDWDEVEERYGDVVYTRAGYAKIEATIADDSEAIFTPCRYVVGNVQVLEGEGGEAVTEIASFRGRFCEQARTGERVIAQGKVEKMQKKDGDTSFRLLLGGKPSDFMALAR